MASELLTQPAAAGRALFRRVVWLALLSLGLCLPGWSPTAASQSQAPAPTDYIIGAQDVLQVLVFDQEDLGGKYPVDTDGTFTFPLIGRVKAAGMTVRQVETELKRALVDGQHFKNPQLSVSIDQYRSQRI